MQQYVDLVNRVPREGEPTTSATEPEALRLANILAQKYPAFSASCEPLQNFAANTIALKRCKPNLKPLAQAACRLYAAPPQGAAKGE
jgi:hypothetical protein